MKKLLSILLMAFVILQGIYADDDDDDEDEYTGVVVRSLALFGSYDYSRLTFYDDDPYDDFDVSLEGFGFKYTRMTVSGGTNMGASFLLGCDLGFSYMSLDIPEQSSASLNGFQTGFKVGFGLAPVCNDNLIVAAHAFLGGNYKDLDGSYRKRSIRYTAYDMCLGLDCILTVQSSKNLNIFAGLDVSSSVKRAAIINYTDDSHDANLGTNISVNASCGIAWVFDD